MLLPAGSLSLLEIRPIMGPDAILPPERRFRDALRYLHHVLDFQRRSGRKRLDHELRPARELRAGPNERLARTNDTDLAPHRAPERAAQLLLVS